MSRLEKYSSYKDSGVERIGKIPEHWTINRINTVGTIVSGATPSSSVLNYWNGDITWITPTDINNKIIIRESERTITAKGYASCGTSLVPKGTIVMTTRAPIGKLVIAGNSLCTNQGCKSIIPTKGFDKRFIYFQLLVNSEKLNSLGTGTTFMELSKMALKNLFLAFPPKEEQTKIANFLDKKTAQINEAIKQKEELINLLKERRQVLIHKAVTQGLDATVKMKGSGVEWLGEVPEHWEVLPGFRVYKENKTKNNGMVEEQVLSLSYGKIVIKPKEKLTGLVPESFETYQIVKPGDIIIRCMDLQNDKTSLRTGIAKDDGIITSAYLNLNVIKSFNSEYLHYYLHMLDITKVLYKFGTGLRQNLSYYDFKRLPVLVPDEIEQKNIVEYIKMKTQKIDNSIKLQEKQIEKIKEYKATLIDSLVTGKAKVI